MPDVLIRDVPGAVLQVLKARAQAHRRSLQGELLAVLEHASRQMPDQSPAEVADRIRAELAARGGAFTNSTLDVREDRTR